MIYSILSTALWPIALAVPHVQQAVANTAMTYTTTISATTAFKVTLTKAVTLSQSMIEASETSTSTGSSARPIYTATEIYAFRPDSPIHLLPFQAAGLVFRLGGANGAYCPSFAEKVGGCSMTNMTTINGCALTTWVPGGQAIYLAPDGSLRYTQPHSQYVVPGSLICPLSHTRVTGSDASEIMVAGFGATAFMACPMLGSTRVREYWQVYADTDNVTVPLRHGNSSSCLSFEAVGIMKTMDATAIAWEYV